MKRCPECRRDYYDDTLFYCLDDGNALLDGSGTMDGHETVAWLGAQASGRPAGEQATRILKPNQISIPEPNNSIAVMPFTNISNDAENEYFCDGLAEELLSALAKIDDLKVAARTSAFSFKGRKVDIGHVARALNVKTVLEGSVRKSGDRLRIAVQLVNTADGYSLWSEIYDRQMLDIFDVQDEITRAVVEALKIKLLGANGRAGKPVNIDAYELYLKGKYHLSKLTPVDMQTSIEYFHRAIDIDQSYAKAHVALSDAYMRISIAGELPPKEFFPKSKTAAQRAIEIDSDLVEGHVALAWIAFWYDSNWEAAENHCRRALELGPHDPDAHLAYAHLLSFTGRHTEALFEVGISRKLDPLALFNAAMEVQFLLHAGLTDQALMMLEELRAFEPGFWLTHLFLASALIEKGRFTDALSAANAAAELSGGSMNAIAFKAYALAKAGERDEVEELISRVSERAAKRYTPAYHIAQVYHAFGDRKGVYEHLEQGMAERDVKMVFLKVDPKWNNIRDESQFQELLGRIGSSRSSEGTGRIL